MVSELLQQVGLNKYEAEAYLTLVRHGALTGYELGKRSGVPLSRSYEVLERLAAKGMALVQPGDPPRYRAEPPAQLLERTRAAMATTLDALEQGLAEAAQPAAPQDFWVIRSRSAILATARSQLEAAGGQIEISMPADIRAGLTRNLDAARGRGCRVVERVLEGNTFTLVTDDHEGLVGTLAPADECQAVRSSNPALVEALRLTFAPAVRAPQTARQENAPRSTEPQRLDWLAWEERKQRHLLGEQGVSSA